MSEPLSMDQAFVRKLSGIVLANISDENFGAKMLAEKAGMSYASLHRKLKAVTHLDISQFIREIRLRRAMEMLQNNEGNVAEIAFRVGFGSATYFNRCFHEYFGYPPGEVRKKEPVVAVVVDGEKIAENASWIYDIKSTGSEDSNPVHIIKRGNQPSHAISRLWNIVAFASLAIIVALSSLYFIKSRKLGSDISKYEKSIAVLPFINDSGNDSTTYFINGLMEEILNNLQKIGAFKKVLSRNSVEMYRNNKTKSTPEIASELGVNFIVEGSGQKYGNYYRLRVQLIEGRSGKHLWADSYESEIKDVKDIFGIQNEIALSIATELKATITPEEKQLIDRTLTTSLTAYDFYQRGKEELNKYLNDIRNQQTLIRTEELYRLSLKYDSTFAKAYVGLAWVYAYKHYFESYYLKNFLDSSLILINRALTYDDRLAEAYFARAQYFVYTNNIKEASKDFDKALKFNPNYWEAYYYKGENVYLYGDDVDYTKAIEFIQKAISLNHEKERPALLREIALLYSNHMGFPDRANYYLEEALKLDADTTSDLYSRAEIELYNSGNFRKAIEFLNKCYLRDSNNFYFISELALSDMHNGEYKESLKYFKKLIQLMTNVPRYLLGYMHRIAYVYWQNGDKNKADYWFKEQISLSKKNILAGTGYYVGAAYYDLAGVYAFNGEKEKAYENLRIINKRSVLPLWWVNLLKKNDPLFNSIRSEPEFQQIVRDVEAKYQKEHERVRKWLEENKML